MSRIRIIIPAATIERTKLYLTRGGALLLCVFLFPIAAHASPFDAGISSIQTLFTGTIAKAASLIAIVIGGYRRRGRMRMDLIEQYAKLCRVERVMRPYMEAILCPLTL